MVWKTVNNSDSGTATKHGGNDVDKICNRMNGNDVSDPDIYSVDLNTLKATTNVLGDILKSNGTKYVRFAKGTANQVLRTNAAATDLEWATLATGGDITSGANVGSGAGTVFKDKTGGNTLNFKSILAGTNVSVTNNASDITIASTAGDISGAANVGTGTGDVFRDESAGVLNLKTIKAGTNVTITNNTDDVTIASTGGGGGGTDVLPMTYTFIIYKSGSDYIAQNGATGGEDYTNTNARILLNTISTAFLDTAGASLKLFFKNGTYLMDGTSVQWGTTGTGAGASVDIEGESRDGVIIKNTFVPGGTPFYMWQPYCKCTIRNMTFDGDALGDFVAGEKVLGIVSETTTNGRTFQMYNCHIKKFTGVAVVVDQDTFGTDVRNCWFDAGAGEEYLAFGANAYGYVVNNFFDRQNATYNPWTALTMGQGTNVVIEGNVLRGQAGQQSGCITVEAIHPTDSNYERITIANNHLMNGEIIVGGFDNAGLIFRDINIEGNNLITGRILIQGPATASITDELRNINVLNNKVSESLYGGIVVRRMDAFCTVRGNVIRDSNLSATVSNSEMGMIFVGAQSRYTIVEDNTLLALLGGSNITPYALGAANSDNVIFRNNFFTNFQSRTGFADWGGNTNLVVKKNDGISSGYLTENSGLATVANGTTSIAVNHGLVETPLHQNIHITPTNSMGNATKFSVTNPTSTQFTINVNVDPGASTAAFSWVVFKP